MSEIEHDRVTGITRKWTFDNDKVIIHTSQDVSSILDENQLNYNDGENTVKSIRKGWVHYASIPAVIAGKWMTEHGVNIYSTDPDQNKAVFKLLNSRDYRRFKRVNINHG